MSERTVSAKIKLAQQLIRDLVRLFGGQKAVRRLNEQAARVMTLPSEQQTALFADQLARLAIHERSFVINGQPCLKPCAYTRIKTCRDIAPDDPDTWCAACHAASE